MNAAKIRSSSPITDNKRSVTPPVFTVPNEQPVSNTDELLDYNSAEVPGSQLDLRRHRLSLDEEPTDEGDERVEYEQLCKRQRLENAGDIDQYEQVPLEVVSHDTGYSPQESVASQLSFMDSLSLDLMMGNEKKQGLTSSSADEESFSGVCSGTDTGISSGGGSSVTTRSISGSSSNRNQLLNSSPFCLTPSETPVLDIPISSTPLASISLPGTRSPDTLFPAASLLAASSPGSPQVEFYSITRVEREMTERPNHSPVPVDDVADLSSIAGDEITLYNSLSSADRSSSDHHLQSDADILSHLTDMDRMSDSFVSDLSFEHSQPSSYSTSYTLDQQVPVSSEDEIDNYLRQRQLRSCTDQTVPNRDIEE